MQLHTAQHALSCFAADRFGSRTGRADFAPGGGLVVIEPELDWKQALLLENDVNRLIRAGRPVSRRVDEEGGTRIAIDGLEETRCAGTHVTSTSEIGLFKLLSLDGKVLRYEVGTAAMRHAVRSAGHAQEASRRLGLERTRELATAVDELIAERDRAEKRFEQWRGEATARNATSARRTASLRADGVAVLRVDLTHLGARESRELLEKGLTAPGEVWVGLAERGSLMVSSGSERVDARAVVSELTDRWSIRGGGGLRFAQCGPVPDDVGSPLKEAVDHIMTTAERVLP